MMVTLVTGGFDPVHPGHIELLYEAQKAGGHHIIVGLNSDEWLARKKGYVFMPFEDRRKVLEELYPVDIVIGFDDSEGHAGKLITQLRPTHFINGGDRKNESDIPLAEVVAAHAVGTRLVFAGEKIGSSSELLAKASKELNRTYRDWGHYDTLFSSPELWVKRIVIRPCKAMSRQRHAHRSERWHLVEGQATNHGSVDRDLRVGEPVYVRGGEWHQLEAGPSGAVIIEVGWGDYVSEDDIERSQ